MVELELKLQPSTFPLACWSLSPGRHGAAQSQGKSLNVFMSLTRAASETEGLAMLLTLPWFIKTMFFTKFSVH